MTPVVGRLPSGGSRPAPKMSDCAYISSAGDVRSHIPLGWLWLIHSGCEPVTQWRICCLNARRPHVEPVDVNVRARSDVLLQRRRRGCVADADDDLGRVDLIPVFAVE
eukprot:678467-Pleurochrysis_carterae.AAC.1